MELHEDGMDLALLILLVPSLPISLPICLSIAYPIVSYCLTLLRVVISYHRDHTPIPSFVFVSVSVSVSYTNTLLCPNVPTHSASPFLA